MYNCSPLGKTACSGDSGGPMYDRGKSAVVGLTSFSKFPCDSAPVVYARVSAQIDWIQSVVCNNTAGSIPSFCSTMTTTSPTKATTKSPPISITQPQMTSPSNTSVSCVDSTLKFKLRKDGKLIKRDCVWVKNRPYRCNEYNGDIASHCPKTCNQCLTCQDTTLRFMLQLNGKRRTRDCKWVKNSLTNFRCDKEGVRETCQNTCGLC